MEGDDGAAVADQGEPRAGGALEAPRATRRLKRRGSFYAFRLGAAAALGVIAVLALAGLALLYAQSVGLYGLGGR